MDVRGSRILAALMMRFCCNVWRCVHTFAARPSRTSLGYRRQRRGVARLGGDL